MYNKLLHGALCYMNGSPIRCTIGFEQTYLYYFTDLSLLFHGELFYE